MLLHAFFAQAPPETCPTHTQTHHPLTHNCRWQHLLAAMPHTQSPVDGCRMPQHIAMDVVIQQQQLHRTQSGRALVATVKTCALGSSLCATRSDLALSGTTVGALGAALLSWPQTRNHQPPSSAATATLRIANPRLRRRKPQTNVTAAAGRTTCSWEVTRCPGSLLQCSMHQQAPHPSPAVGAACGHMLPSSGGQCTSPPAACCATPRHRCCPLCVLS